MKYFITFITLLLLGVVLWFFVLPQISLGKHDLDNNLQYKIVTKMTACSELAPQSSWGCLQEVAKELHSMYLLADILAAIDASREEQVIFDYCHRFGHVLGRQEYALTGSVSEALKQTSFICESSSIHGVIEGFVMDKGWQNITDERLTNFVTTVCWPVYQADRLNNPVYDACLHGVGHALMFVTENDLPYSLALCDSLLRQDDAGTCYSGSFMENNIGSSEFERTNTGHISEYMVDPSDPLFPCNILEEQYLPLCYQYRADFVLRSTVGDFNKAINLCSQIPGQHQSSCFYKIGEAAPHWLPGYPQVKTICDQIGVSAGDENWAHCLRGAVTAIMWKYGGDLVELNSFCGFFKEKNKGSMCRDFVLGLTMS